MNVAIAYKDNDVLSKVNNLLFAMMHYNCLETKTRQPRDDGIVEKWTQYVDFATRKCGSKNNRQSRATTTHNFLCVTRMVKFCCRIFLQHRKSWKFFELAKRAVLSNFEIRFACTIQCWHSLRSVPKLMSR
jgi:hypothetical protein